MWCWEQSRKVGREMDLVILMAESRVEFESKEREM